MGLRAHHQWVAGRSLPNGYGAKTGEGRPFAIFATICPYEENRLLCEERTLSPIPNVAKAVKTASGIRPN